MENCHVPEENRLQLDTSFRDTARVLRMTRAFVAWEAVGCMMGAYEHALAYAPQAGTIRKTYRKVSAHSGSIGDDARKYHCPRSAW